MRLYITPGSPYARIARMMVIEKGLQDRVEIVLPQTRTPGSPYYQINPSGRVPFLERDDGGPGLEESSVICRYLDHLDGNPAFDPPSGADLWESLRLGALATTLMDGLAVWIREKRRPEAQQSAPSLTHEADRAKRLTDCWEQEIGHKLMQGPLTLPQITLISALGLEARLPAFQWHEGHPNLHAWFSKMAARPSVAETMPPQGR